MTSKSTVKNLTSTKRKEIVYNVVNKTQHNDYVLICFVNEIKVFRSYGSQTRPKGPHEHIATAQLDYLLQGLTELLSSFLVAHRGP